MEPENPTRGSYKARRAKSAGQTTRNLSREALELGWLAKQIPVREVKMKRKGTTRRGLLANHKEEG